MSVHFNNRRMHLKNRASVINRFFLLFKQDSPHYHSFPTIERLSKRQRKGGKREGALGRGTDVGGATLGNVANKQNN